MNITKELIKRLRHLLNEEIPENGVEADTLFSDIDISITAGSAESENHTLYLLWTQKAGLIQKNASDIKSIHAGGESVEKYTAVDYVLLCLKMAQGYKEAWDAEKKSGSASFLMCTKKNGDILW